MTTLLYGGQPGADVAPGNRADAEDEPDESGMHPRLLPTIELRAYAADATGERPFVRPSRASSSWLPPPPIGLPTLVLALACVAAIFAGLAAWGVAIAWASTSSTLTTLGLSLVGSHLIVSGLALLLWGTPQQQPNR